MPGTGIANTGTGTAIMFPTATKMRMVTFAWTSTSGGAFSITTSEQFSGWVCSLETIPGGTTPSDLYDLVLNNDNGTDLMGGAGADRSATTKEIVLPLNGGSPVVVPICGTKLTLVGSNAGNAKTGTAYVYIQDR